MDITRLSPDDAAGCVAAVELLIATHAVDCPAALLSTPTSYAADLRYGWDGDPGRTYLARDESGALVGLLQFFAPNYDNTHLAWIGVEVHPDHRGHGIGTELVRYAEQVARDLGRTTFGIGTWDLPKADAFAKRNGFEQAAIEVNRRQDIATLDWSTVQKLYDEAVLASEDYEVLRITGELPEDMLDSMVTLTAAINDAPRDDLDVEDDIFSPERMRAYEAAQRAHDRTLYRVVARQRSTGALAGHSVVIVERERPYIAEQHDTPVSRDHRGHRLGALVKTDMLRWLREAEPQVSQLDTWNAESNNHMIAINEQLNYYVVARTIDYQKKV